MKHNEVTTIKGRRINVIVLVPTIVPFSNTDLLLNLIDKYITRHMNKDSNGVDIFCNINSTTVDMVAKHIDDDRVTVHKFDANLDNEDNSKFLKILESNVIDYYLLLNNGGEYDKFVDVLIENGINHMSYDFLAH